MSAQKLCHQKRVTHVATLVAVTAYWQRGEMTEHGSV